MDLKSIVIFSCLVLLLVLSACSTSHPLVDTPNLYAHSNGYSSANVSSHVRTTAPEILFVTDRRQEISPDGSLSYGSERSTSMAFGAATIAFGPNLTWEDLSRASSMATRDQEILLSLVGTKENERFPETPLPNTFSDGEIDTQPEAEEE